MGSASPDTESAKSNTAQTNIAGNVAGSVLSGNFYGPVHVGDVNVIYQHARPTPVSPEQLAEAQRLLATLPLDALPEPGALPPGSRLIFARNPLFTGRAPELQQLARVLKDEQTLAAITGLGGLGKTQLAVEFAHRYGRFFAGGVFWVSLASADDVKNQIAQCGGAAGLQLRADYDALKLDEQVALVLSAWQSALPRLLIFDNCEDENLLAHWRPPAGGCRILVTSRRAEWDLTLGLKTVPLGVLPRADSVAFLQKFRLNLGGAQDQASLPAIATELGDLPLALHLAGCYLDTLHRSQAGQPTVLLTKLRQAGILQHTLFRAPWARVSPTGHAHDVIHMFQLSYAQLQPQAPIDQLALQALARIACFLPGEFIAHDLCLETLGDAEAEDLQIQAEQALLRLTALGLLEMQANGAVRQHRLLTAFVRQLKADPVAPGAFTAGVARYALRHTQDWAALEFALPNLLQAVDQAAPTEKVEMMSALVIGDRHRPPENGSSYFKKRGHTPPFLARFDQTIAAARTLGGATAEPLHYLLSRRGDAYVQQNQMEEAVRAYEESLTLAPSTMRKVILQCALGLALGQLEQNLQALAYLQEAETTARVNVDSVALLYALEYRSSFAGRHNDFETARRYAEEAVYLNHTLGDRVGEGYALLNLGSATFDLGEAQAAFPIHQAALHLARELGELRLQARALHALGGDADALHQREEAHHYFADALKLYHQIGDAHNQQRLETFLKTHQYPAFNS